MAKNASTPPPITNDQTNAYRSPVLRVETMMSAAKTITGTYMRRMKSPDAPAEMPKGTDKHAMTAKAAISLGGQVNSRPLSERKRGFANARKLEIATISSAGRT